MFQFLKTNGKNQSMAVLVGVSWFLKIHFLSEYWEYYEWFIVRAFVKKRLLLQFTVLHILSMYPYDS